MTLIEQLVDEYVRKLLDSSTLALGIRKQLVVAPLPYIIWDSTRAHFPVDLCI